MSRSKITAMPAQNTINIHFQGSTAWRKSWSLQALQSRIANRFIRALRCHPAKLLRFTHLTVPPKKCAKPKICLRQIRLQAQRLFVGPRSAGIVSLL